MVNKFRICFMPLALALILLSGSCAQPQKIKLKLYARLLMNSLFVPIAQEEGLFAEQGLEVELVEVGGTEKAIPALIQGKLDVALGDIRPSMLNAAFRGGKIRIVSGLGSVGPEGHSRMTFVAKKALVERLNDPAQLRGRKIAASRMGIAEYHVDKAIERVGLTLDDIVIMNDIPIPIRSEALEKGAVDIISTTEPWITRLMRSGDNAEWMPASEIIPNMQTTVILFGPNLINANPDAGRKFMVAYLKAVQKINEGKTQQNLEIASKFTGLDMEILKEISWYYLFPDGRINVESVMKYQMWALEKGYIDGLAREDQLFDFSFIEYANQAIAKP